MIIIRYLNKHHPDLLLSFAKAFSKLGTIQAKKNAFSGGSYKIVSATLVGIDLSKEQNALTLDTKVQIRGEAQERDELVLIPLGENRSQSRYFCKLLMNFLHLNYITLHFFEYHYLKCLL